MSYAKNLEILVKSASKHPSRKLEKLVTATFDSQVSGKLYHPLEISKSKGNRLPLFKEG